MIVYSRLEPHSELEPFYLTDASKEEKVEYYKMLEANWRKESRKHSIIVTVRMCVTLLFAMALLIVPTVLEVYFNVVLSPVTKAKTILLGILAFIILIIDSKNLVMGSYSMPPVELSFWWRYAEEKYGITPDWKIDGKAEKTKEK